jgi:hypothetical protein
MKIVLSKLSEALIAGKSDTVMQMNRPAAARSLNM